MNEGITEKVRAAGGALYAISSEPQALSDRAHEQWHLDFPSVGDPHHEIADGCRERGWLDLFVNERMEFLVESTSGAVDWKPSHPKGYFQPGVLALSRDGRVLYRWRGVPTHRNMGGATERPTATHVWEHIERSLTHDAASEDAPLDTNPDLDSPGIPWVLFASLLLANGWFIRPRGFRSAGHIVFAVARLLAFVAAWVAAFIWLPTAPVLLALAAWIAFVLPGLRWVSREFQNAEETG